MLSRIDELQKNLNLPKFPNQFNAFRIALPEIEQQTIIDINEDIFVVQCGQFAIYLAQKDQCQLYFYKYSLPEKGKDLFPSQEYEYRKFGFYGSTYPLPLIKLLSELAAQDNFKLTEQTLMLAVLKLLSRIRDSAD